jgi:hypothetical protein
VRRRGVRPGVLERAETGAGLLDGIEDVEQVACGARQAVQARDNEHIARLEPVDRLSELGAVAARAGCVAAGVDRGAAAPTTFVSARTEMGTTAKAIRARS